MNRNGTRALVEGGIMIALAFVLSWVRIFKLPWGGSITLLSMLPIIIYSIKYGIKRGFMVSGLFSLVQFGQGVADGLFSWGLTPGMLVACIFIDYIAAFSVLGFGGLFRNKGVGGWIAGTVVAGLLRFLCHFLSGVVIWKSFGELWNGFSTDNTVVYSLLYNGAYMLPEIIFTVIGAVVLFSVPQTKRMIVVDDNAVAA